MGSQEHRRRSATRRAVTRPRRREVSVSTSGPVIRDIGDTARWAAVYRARETDRPNRLFDDPFAQQLAGARGVEIAAAMPFSEENEWAWITRTYLFDQFVTEQVQAGVDLIVN